MFGLFRNNNAAPPIDEATRHWIEELFLWLIDTFGEEQIRAKQILRPDPEDFPVTYDGTYEAALETMHIVASQMEVDPDSIALNLFIRDDDRPDAGGLYKGLQDGKYWIDIEVGMLKEPMRLVAVLAHEIAHIKLLGEGRIDENNEHLTDLTTIVFGLGIFNANSAFQFSTDSVKKSWSNLGYLSQMEWGYALALYSYIRGEKEPAWIGHLSKNVKGDFLQSERFIYDNEEEVLRRDRG
jgi:hypothetical protein